MAVLPWLPLSGQHHAGASVLLQSALSAVLTQPGGLPLLLPLRPDMSQPCFACSDLEPLIDIYLMHAEMKHQTVWSRSSRQQCCAMSYHSGNSRASARGATGGSCISRGGTSSGGGGASSSSGGGGGKGVFRSILKLGTVPED